MKKIILFLFLTIILGLSVNAYAQIETILKNQIAHQTEDSVIAVAIGDYDNNSILEFAVLERNYLTLYSSLDNSIIFKDTLPTIHDSVSIYLDYQKLIYADVDRDSIPDLLIGRYYPDTLTGYLYPSIFKIYFYSGEELFINHTFSEPTIISKSANAFHFGLSCFQAIDIDNDGFNETVISYDSLLNGANYPYEYHIGKTDYYYSFPDSSYITFGCLGKIDSTSSPSNKFISSLNYYSSGFGSLGLADGSLVTRKPITFIDDLTNYSVNRTQIVLPDEDPQAIYNQTVRIKSFPTIGNMYINNNNYELLYHYHYRDITEWYPLQPPGDPYDYDSSGTLLVMEQFITDDSTELLWTLDIENNNYHSFYYSPMTPGKFFGFIGDTLILFNGTDGSVHSQANNFYPGFYSWLYDYDLPTFISVESENISIYQIDIATDINESNINLPISFSLSQNYPNPFNPTTEIEYSLATKGNISISIYNLIGQRVATLIDEQKEAGSYKISWDASEFSSGIYLIKAESDRKIRTVKALLLK